MKGKWWASVDEKFERWNNKNRMMLPTIFRIHIPMMMYQSRSSKWDELCQRMKFLPEMNVEWFSIDLHRSFELMSLELNPFHLFEYFSLSTHVHHHLRSLLIHHLHWHLYVVQWIDSVMIYCYYYYWLSYHNHREHKIDLEWIENDEMFSAMIRELTVIIHIGCITKCSW